MSVYHWAYRMFLALCRPLFILVSIYPYLTVWVWNPISSHVCLFYPSLPLYLSSHASLYHYVSLGPYLSFRLSASISLYGFISSSVMAASKHHLILYNSGENKQKARWQWAKTTVIFGYQGFQAHSNIQIALIFFLNLLFPLSLFILSLSLSSSSSSSPSSISLSLPYYLHHHIITITIIVITIILPPSYCYHH